MGEDVEKKKAEPAGRDRRTVHPFISSNGRDEMNLAEFPFASIQYQGGEKTMVFSDTISGKDGQPVERCWTVTGSDAYGLPVAGDVDIAIALLALSQEQGMKSREVLFSRYDLLQIMGWDNRGRNYGRIKDGLDRLTGTTIKAERAFYDKQKQAYLSRSFHIIDDYDLWDRANGSGDAGALPLKSMVTWNQYIFKSIKAGYVKRLDTERYFRLSSPIAKQLYRYLDKKFHRATGFQIEIFKLCHEHLGLSRGCKHVSKLKERLEPALRELVRDGYLHDYDYAPSRTNRKSVIVQFTKGSESREETAASSPATFFYDQLHGAANSHHPASGSERAMAESFINKHGLDVFREFVDFVMRVKPSRWPELATLSGAFQAFERPFLARLIEREARQQEVQRERNQRERDRLALERYTGYIQRLRDRMKREQSNHFEECEREAQASPAFTRATAEIARLSAEDGPLSKAARQAAEKIREDEFNRYFIETFKAEGALDFDSWRDGEERAQAHHDQPAA